jgi:hypothetical protein
MQYFTFISGFFFLTLVFNSTKPIKEQVYIYYFIVIFVALAVGLRGNDDEYTRVYVMIPSLGDFFSGNYPVINEKGWVFGFISSFFKTLNFNSQSIFLFFSSTAVFLHAFFFRKYTKYYFLAFLLYLSHEIAFKEWNGLRMGFASALLLPMIYYLEQDKKIKFFILVIIATLVQYVAILSFLLYFFNRKIKPKYLLFGLLVSVLIAKFHIVYNLVWFLDSSNLTPNIVSSYLGYEAYVYDAGLTHAKTIQQIITLLVLIFLFGYKINTSKIYNLLFHAYYLSTIFYITFSELALFAFRFGGHFYSVEPILLTYIVTTFKQRNIAANMIASISLIAAYLNYIVVGRVSPYDLFVNYPT